MKIRFAEAKDLDELDSIRIKSIKGLCSEFYDDAQVKSLIVRGVEKDAYEKAIERSRILVISDKNEIDGYIMFRLPLKASSAAHIDGIYVNASSAKNGLGRKLLERFEEIVKEAGITQIKLITTKNAEPFFNKMGYDISGPALRQTMEGQVINLQPIFKNVILPPKD